MLLQAHSPLLLLLRPSKADQAKAYLQFFQANFWYNVIFFVQDALVADGFYEQMKENVTADSKWNIDTHIIPEDISDSDLKSTATSLLLKDPKIVVIHADLSFVRRIFTSLNEVNVTSLNHAWFITDSSMSKDEEYLKLFPTGTLSIGSNYAVNIEDVILDGTNFIIKSVIQHAYKASIPRNCFNTSIPAKRIGEGMLR